LKSQIYPVDPEFVDPEFIEV